MCLSYN
jgi:hypothetical protein